MVRADLRYIQAWSAGGQTIVAPVRAAQLKQAGMPYVRRNSKGRIVALLAEPAPDAGEQLPANHMDVLAFLGGGEQVAFGMLDADFVRVTEDLIYTLIEKGLLQFTDLPQEAQRKLRDREGFRSRRVTGALDLISGSDVG